MPGPFNDEELASLASQVDAELGELHKAGRPVQWKGEGPAPELPTAQRKALEAVVGEDAESFLARFRDAARRDLCEPDGVLYEQWQRWGDLGNKKVLDTFGAVLVAMGFSGNVLQVAVVALAVIVLHVGVRAICER